MLCMPDDRDASIKELGELGEEIVVCLFSLTSKIEYAGSDFDDEKDLIIDNKQVEIKTQTRLRARNLFTTAYKRTNINKCMNVDVLLFVEFDETDYISIWTPRDREHYTDYQIETMSGLVSMRGWYINKNEIGPGCRLIRKIKLPQISERMRALSPSQFYDRYKKSTTYSRRASS